MTDHISNGPSPKLVAAAERAKGSVAPGKHTRTPWDMKRATRPSDGEFDYAISATIDGEEYCIAEVFSRVDVTIRPDAYANASLIVRAVNEREGLIEALESALAMLRHTADDLRFDISETLLSSLLSECAKARAALSKAGQP